MPNLPAVERLSLRDAPEVLSFLLSLDEETIRFFHPHPFDIEHVRSLLSGPVAAFKAVDTSEEGAPVLAGYAWLSGMDTSRPAVWICVGPGRRNRGIGRALMTRLIEEAVLRNKREISLTVPPYNAPALRLARSLGLALLPETQHGLSPSRQMRLTLPNTSSERAQAIRRRLEGGRLSIIPYCHADWAWVHTRNWHHRRYALVFTEVLEWMRRDSAFRWYFDNYACHLSAFLEFRPDLLPELRERIAQGRIAICGGYANVRPQMVGNESFVRNLILGQRAFRTLFPEADLSVHADAVDVATGHPQLPQILRQAGYRCLRIWRPYAAMSLKGIPNEFIWRGLESSEILTSRGLYGGQWHISEGHKALRSPAGADWDDVLAAFWDSDIEGRARYSASGEIWLAHGSDDSRPGRMLDDTPFDIQGLMERWSSRESVPIRFATPVEQFAALEADRACLPVIEGTLDPCDVAYNAAWNGEKGLAVRRIENDRLLVQAELYATLSGLPYPEEDLAALWKDHLLTCAHATQWLYTEDFAYIARLADRVQAGAEAVREKAIHSLIEQAALPPGTLCLAVNPLPYERRVPVSVHLSRYGDMWPAVLGDGSGTPLEGQIVKTYSGQGGFPEQQIVAMVDVPPLGMAVIREMPSETGYEPVATPSEAMGNGCLGLSFSGFRLSAVTDKESGRIWEAPPDQEWGELVLQDVAVREGPLHVGPITGERACVWESIDFPESGPVRWRCRREGRIGAMGIVCDAILHAGQPYLEFEVSLDWPGHDGFLSARIPMPEGNLYGDIPFGVEEKHLEEEPYEADHRIAPHSMERTRNGLFYTRSFAACQTDARTGVAFIGGNTDRYYIRNQAKGFLEHILINSVMTLDDWERNVESSTLTGQGPHRFRYRLLFYRGSWREAGVVRQAASLVEPILVTGTRHGGPSPSPTLPPGSPILAIEPAHVMLSALYREGKAVCLRLYETAGQPAEAIVSTPWEITSADLITLNGDLDPTVPVSRCRGILKFSLSPWQICTLRIAR
ncbi:MAG: GNAT family N-acetyltransferase [Armatimonadetes bacterium]|nr:GNAT family N-acetyltransferase [Armatimonadota bacterium]